MSSVGIEVAIAEANATSTGMLRGADAATYRTKDSGRVCVVVRPAVRSAGRVSRCIGSTSAAQPDRSAPVPHGRRPSQTDRSTSAP